MRRSSFHAASLAGLALLAALALPGVASAQRGHRVVRDWTVAFGSPSHIPSGYDPDGSRLGLTEYEGDVEGTFLSWGFGGVWLEWSAPAIAGAAAVPFGLFLLLGAATSVAAARRCAAKPTARE